MTHNTLNPRYQQIKAASNYRIHEGEGVRGWEEAAFEAGARWADENPLPQPPRDPNSPNSPD